MKIWLPVLLLNLILFGGFGCKKEPLTPETTFKKFSHWTKLGQPEAMENFADKEFVDNLRVQYDGLSMLSETWPSDPVVLESKVENNQAELTVEGLNFLGEPVTGTFTLYNNGEKWIVKDGYWGQRFRGFEEGGDEY